MTEWRINAEMERAKQILEQQLVDISLLDRPVPWKSILTAEQCIDICQHIMKKES